MGNAASTLIFEVMKRYLTLFISLLTAAPALAESPNTASDFVNIGIAADLGTTAIGLAAGLSEANPLGIGVVPIKFLIKSQIDKIPDENERREVSAAFSAVQFGAAAANLCTLAALHPAAAVLCMVGGMSYGYSKVKSIPTDMDCMNRHMEAFQLAVATKRQYKVDLKTCVGHFVDQPSQGLTASRSTKADTRIASAN
jgi:hypothetical protein